jgi:hypothetical protein
MRLVKEDILDVVFATRILQGIILGLLVDVTIILSSTLKPKLIIRSAIKSIFRGGGGRLKHKEAFVIEP